jgi:hypothetical protein
MKSVGYGDIRDDTGIATVESEGSARNPFGTSVNAAPVET